MAPIIPLAIITAAAIQAAGGTGATARMNTELTRFQGVWALVSAQTGSRVSPPEQIEGVRVTIRGNRHTVTLREQVVAHEIEFRVDPDASPRAVEDTLPDGRKIRGIYEIDGDVLRSCVAPADQPRPRAFCEGDGYTPTLRVFRRVAP